MPQRLLPVLHRDRTTDGSARLSKVRGDELDRVYIATNRDAARLAIVGTLNALVQSRAVARQRIVTMSQ
jgi:hypothetical protein